MKVYYQLEEPMFNGGLGVLPVSIELIYAPTKPPVSIEYLYSEIKATSCLDLIVQGPVTDESSIEGLSWLTPKLISEGYFISYHTNIEEKLPNIIFTRYIFDADMNVLRRRKELGEFKSNVVIILGDKTIPELRISRGILLKANIKAKVMFDEGEIDRKLILEGGMYDLHPYRH